MNQEFYTTREVLEAILTSIDEGIHVIDTKGYTIFYNKVAAERDRMKVEEVLGAPLIQSFPSLNHHSSTLLKVIERGVPIKDKQQSYMNIHGKMIETINTTLPLHVNGELIGAIEIAKDYSNLKALKGTNALDIQPLRKALKQAEEELISNALTKTKGNVLQAAKLLQIPRQTLQYKLSKI